MGSGGEDGNGESDVSKGGSGGMRGSDGVRLRRLDAGVAGIQDVVVAMHQGPLGRPIACSDEGDAVDKVSVQARVKGEGSTGAVSALAAGSVGDDSVSDMGGKGACMRDDGAGRV